MAPHQSKLPTVNQDHGMSAITVLNDTSMCIMNIINESVLDEDSYILLPLYLYYTFKKRNVIVIERVCAHF